MKYVLPLLLVATSLNAQNAWLHATTTASDFTNATHRFYDVASGPGDSHYFVGEYWRHIGFVGGDLHSLPTTDESHNSFVVQIAADGEELQFFDITGTGYQRANTIEVASDGTLWVGGHFRESFRYQDTVLTAQTFNDSYLLHLQPTGELIDLFHFHGNNLYDVVNLDALTISDEDDLWLALNFLGDFTFAGTTYTSGTWNGDAIVARLNASGEVQEYHYLNSEDVGEAGQFSVTKLLLNSQNELLLAGTQGETLVFSDDVTLTNNSYGANAWMAQFDQAGEVVWTQQLPATTSHPSALVFDAQDRLYAGIQFSDYLLFDGGSYSGSGSFAEMAVARYSKTGQPQWIQLFKQPFFCGNCGIYPRQLLVDDDRLILGGFFNLEMQNEGNIILGNPDLPQTAYLLTLSLDGVLGLPDTRLVMPGSTYSRLNCLTNTPDGYLYGGEFFGNVSVRAESTQAPAGALFYGLLPNNELVNTTLPSSQTTLTVYPNPSAQVLQIDQLPAGTYDYNITNSLGQAVQEGQLAADAHLGIATLPAGTYYLQLLPIDRAQRIVLPFVKAR